MNINQSNLCAAIARYFGWESQKGQTMQELNECMAELLKRPDQRGKDWTGRLRTEIADCMIMLEQMAIMLDGGTDKVSAEIDFKLKRTTDNIISAIARRDFLTNDDREYLENIAGGAE